jgi:hypothetical protein
MVRVVPVGSESEERQRILQAVERLSASQVLHGSETLCRLLRFLVTRAWDHHGQPIKEHEIATLLLGRGDDFDPRVDPVVRVQIGRLRSKLVEYYATEGASEEVVIELQKGSYAPSYSFRQTAELTISGKGTPGLPAVPSAPEKAVPAATASQAPRNLFVLALLCLGVGLVLGLTLSRSWSSRWFVSEDNSALRSFWRPLLNSAEPPMVVFSNALFVGRPEFGLHYFDAARDDRQDVIDHYTGTGEVFAIHSLDRLFAGLNAQFTLKRGQLLTWDEAKARNIVFVGSTSENLSLRDIPWEQKYGFATQARGPIREVYIRNLKPAPGEPEGYFASQERPLKKDYALISRMSGPDGTHSILILAGITTIGTQAAVEFACDPARVREMQSHLPQQRGTAFSSVIEIEVKGGVPFSSKLLAVAPLQRGKAQAR